MIVAFQLTLYTDTCRRTAIETTVNLNNGNCHNKHRMNNNGYWLYIFIIQQCWAAPK